MPGVFTVERHIRYKQAASIEGLWSKASVWAPLINKGIRTTSGPLAQVPVAKYTDDLPLYRQERIFGRAGRTLRRSTLAE